MNAVKLQRLEKFLEKYPEMSTVPCLKPGILIRGYFHFKAGLLGGKTLEDSYELEIFVPNEFPREPPHIKEVGGRITREIANGHFLENDNLCLGSHLRLLDTCNKEPTLIGFTNRCLIPYLYAISYKIKYGGSLIFGELEHGAQGLINDYLQIFNLEHPAQVKQVLALLSTKKRIANKQPCPCRCGKRLGACTFHNRLNRFRKMKHRSWFKMHLFQLNK